MKRVLVIAFALAVTTSGLVHAADLPESSLYNLNVTLTDQQGLEQSLDTYLGYPVIVSMFYATCPNVCPILISTIQSLERQLSANELSKLRVILVSLDPANDTPQVLHQVAIKHHIDIGRWKLVRATARDVRMIAAVLSVQYRKLPNDEFNHTSNLTLIDRKGVVRARSAKIPGIDKSFLRAIREHTRR